MSNRERYFAMREGARSAAQDDYFGARPSIDTPENRSTFCAGFDRGHDSRHDELQRLRAEVDDLTDSNGRKADRIDRLGETVERLRAELSQAEATIGKLTKSRDFLSARCDALQVAQNMMRDPERTIVCDILANGRTYETTAPQPTQEAARPISTRERAELSAVQVTVAELRGSLAGMVSVLELLRADHYSGGGFRYVQARSGAMVDVDGAINAANALLSAAPQPQPTQDGARAVIEQCMRALDEELAAWDIWPPIHHVQKARDACAAWLGAPQPQSTAAEPGPTRDAVDAARYRWLRGDTCPDHSFRWMQWEVRCWQAPRWTADLRRGHLDAAIDAAIAADAAKVKP